MFKLKNILILKNLYILLIALIILTNVFTPWLITRGFSFIDEETAEVILIACLFILGYIIYLLYQREVNKKEGELINLKKRQISLEQRLGDAFKYIGAVNIQIQEIRSVFAELKIYPENKKEFKYILEFLGNKILSIINVDWAILRIVDINNLKTLREASVCRGQAAMLKYQFTNEELTKRPGDFKEYRIIKAEQKSTTIEVFSIFPRKQLTKEQEIFIKAILNQVEMLYLIFSSNYFKDNSVNGKPQT